MADKNVIEVTSNNFQQEVLDSPEPILIDFHAEWCPPCKVLSPVIDSLAAEFAGRARVGKVDVDRHPDLAESAEVNSIPTTVVYRDGRVIERFVGLAPREELARALADAA